jgi:selenide,water dikinase
MGGRPLMAIAILGWPVEQLPVETAQQVMDGARKCCAAAGIPLAGGHSIDSVEPFFGLAVTGSVLLKHLKKNNTAQPGDVLFLTKPIGVGVLSTAGKRGVLAQEHEGIAASVMTQLNSIGYALAQIEGVHAMTDVTGFGIAGHLLEMAQGSHLQAHLQYSQLPIIAAAKEYAAQRVVPDGTFRNWNGYGKQVKFMPGVNVMEAFNLLPDPQTNGGLLIAVAPEAAEAVKSILQENGYAQYATPIGFMESISEEQALVIHP